MSLLNASLPAGPRALAAALCGAALLLGPPLSAAGERFQYKLRPGQVLEYRTHVAGAGIMGQPGGEMMKMQMRTAQRVVQRVRSVSGGAITLEVAETPISGKMTAFGQTQEYKPTATRTVYRLDTRGKVLSRKSSAPAGEGGGLTEMGGLDAMWGVQFPNRELKPGDSWEDRIGAPDDPENPPVKVTTRFVGREKVRGRNCAKFTSVFSMPMGGGEEAEELEGPTSTGSVSGTLTTYFDPAAGYEVYSSGSIVIRMKADLSSVSPDAGELANVTKLNYVTSLVPGTPSRK
ncbi:MAG: hypothetical protein ACK47B_14850 [Armatimonadota bacterium]